MTVQGFRDSVLFLVGYSMANIVAGNPDVMKNLKEVEISTRFDTVTNERTIVAKTQNIGKLETILQKTASGNYVTKEIIYYSAAGIRNDIFP